MPSIRYLGPTTNNPDVLTRLRLQQEVQSDLSNIQVQDEVLQALEDKANTYYLNDASAQRVTPESIQGKESTLIKKASSFDPEGPVALSGGRIPGINNMPLSNNRSGGKRWRMSAQYTHDNLQLTTGHYESTNEQQIGSFTVRGPSHAWFPMFIGDFQIGLGKGEVLIKRGGNIVARAIGGNDQGMWYSCPIVPMFSPGSVTGSQTFTVHRRAVFPGVPTNLGIFFRITCIAVPM